VKKFSLNTHKEDEKEKHDNVVESHLKYSIVYKINMYLSLLKF